MLACLEENADLRIIAGWVARTIAGWFVVTLTPGDNGRRPKGNEKGERSVSVVKFGTLRSAASMAKLTDSRQRDVVTYKPGQIVEFHRTALGSVRGEVQEKRFKSGEQWEVLRRKEGAVIVDKGEVVRTGTALHLGPGNSCDESRQPGEDCRPSHCQRAGSRSARRTRHNFMSRCRVRGGPYMSLPIAR
jgi:hypothetical protein